MRIGCICGNSLRDGTDEIPYKSWLLPDQDIADLAASVDARVASHDDESAGGAAYSAILQHSRHAYQCRNCGRLYIDDPDGGPKMQVFRPEDDGWKNVLVSSQGEGAKPWHTNIVAHWDPAKGRGRLWFDPPAGERGGYEEFQDRGTLDARYFGLLEEMRATGQLAGARFGVSAEGQPVHDVHSWRPT